MLLDLASPKKLVTIPFPALAARGCPRHLPLGKDPLSMGQCSPTSTSSSRSSSSFHIFIFHAHIFFHWLGRCSLILPWKMEKTKERCSRATSQQLSWTLWFGLPWWTQEHCVGRILFPCLHLEKKIALPSATKKTGIFLMWTSNLRNLRQPGKPSNISEILWW